MTRTSGAWLAGATAVVIALGWQPASALAPPALGRSVAAKQPPALAADSRMVVAAATSLQRTSREQAVTVTVTPLNLFDSGETLDFRIVLETHSVDLDYDLTRIAELRDGTNVYRPLSWDGPKGGHHVTGVLRFKDRQQIVAAGANYLELQISGVAGVASRLFRWNLKETR
jgi:hypothetical protein